MSGFLAKLKTIFKSGKKTNTPDVAASDQTASILKEGSNQTITYRKKWILGNLTLVMAVLLFLTLAFSLKLTRQSAAQIELIARIQEQNQRLPTILQQTFAGRESAFSQLQETRIAMDQSIALLSQGGYYRQHYTPPVNKEPQLDYLKTIINNWQIEEKKIQFVLNSRQGLVKLGQAINEINTTSSEINKSTGQLIQHMTQTGGLPDQLDVITTMRTLAQNVIRSVNVMLTSKLPVTEIQQQLAHDRKQFSAIVNALHHGHDVLNLAAIEDQGSQEKLFQIKSLFHIIDNNIDTIQTEIAAVMPAKAAANKLIQNNEIMRNSITVLNDYFQIKDVQMTELLEMVIYILTACTFISACGFVYTSRQHQPSQHQSSTNDLDKTQKAMLQLLDDMKKMAEGDLTVRTVVTEDITGAIADAVNYTIEELHTLVEQVNKAGINVVEASDHAQQVSARLLTAAQQQSLKIEETTVALVGMTEAISKVSDTAEESTQVAKQSLATAEKGSAAVRQAIAGMDEIRTHIQDTAKRIKRLGESSQEISEIVALVSDITEQTNVLALNAALQATAAGEAGRGFNMIAQDVQRLAERSAEASKQISRLIKMIQSDTYDTITAMERSTLGVTQGSQRSHAAGKALEEIEAVSKQLAQYVTQIYDTTHAQTQAANTVIENMEQILFITQQTTDGSRETSASINKITGFASELKSSVSSFKV